MLSLQIGFGKVRTKGTAKKLGDLDRRCGGNKVSNR
jgi:hypothetical protein